MYWFLSLRCNLPLNRAHFFWLPKFVLVHGELLKTEISNDCVWIDYQDIDCSCSTANFLEHLDIYPFLLLFRFSDQVIEQRTETVSSSSYTETSSTQLGMDISHAKMPGIGPWQSVVRSLLFLFLSKCCHHCSVKSVYCYLRLSKTA